MENKYYTPTIEEFHVGFEYEIGKYTKVEDNSDDITYHKFTFPDLPRIGIDYNTRDPFEKLKSFKYLRVKYLDREDIESLGFRREFDKFRPVDIFCGHLPNDSEAISHVSYNFDSKILFIQNNQYEDNSTIFLGTVKNKSELKQLLKQLKVN